MTHNNNNTVGTHSHDIGLASFQDKIIEKTQLFLSLKDYATCLTFPFGVVS